MRRACALAVLVLGMHGAFWDGGTAVAQSWPANPIRFIVPFPPGGTTDQIARRVQPLLQADLKTPIIIDNRAGASVPQTGYLEPLLAGGTLAISPLLVLFAVFFWSFLWGIPGAFIGVPATIAMLTMCVQYAGSRWLAVLLSDSASRKQDL